jgi:hypothetical protein
MAADRPPRYAVLFKTYFWDDFIARRLAALAARCAAADLWVVIDNTQGPVGGVMHDRILRTRETDMHRLGLPGYPEGQLNWYNLDYQLLAFHQAHPDYPFYFMTEHDAVVQTDVDALMVEVAARQIDFIAAPNRTPIEEWGWVETLKEIWLRDRILKQLLNISAFAQRAVEYLLMQRRSFSERFNTGELRAWPNNEGFVPSILRDAGFSLETLAHFGSSD